MKPDIFINITATLQSIFKFGENEFYKLAKDHEDLYLYGKNAFVSFENLQPRLHEVDFPGSSLAENSCLRAKLQACSNYIHHISTVGSDQLICGSYYAQPKCEYRNTYFEAHNFISDGSSATNGFVKTLGRDSTVAEVSRGHHSGLFELVNTGDKPYSISDKPLDEIFPAQVQLYAAANDQEVTYLLGTENPLGAPFIAKLCVNNDKLQGPVIESPTSWSSVVRANLRCCDKERNCRFSKPIQASTLRLNNEEELLLVLLQSQEYDDSALCMFRSSELSRFFGSYCSSSRPAMDYTSEALLTTKAQSFDADVKKDALRIALMETNGQFSVSKLTVKLQPENSPIVSPNFHVQLSHGLQKIHQLKVTQNSLILRGEEELLKMDFQSCEVYKTCGTCVAIGDVDCGWDASVGRCTPGGSSDTCDIRLVPVQPKNDFLADTLESIRINTSEIEIFDEFKVIRVDGEKVDPSLFPGQHHKDRSLLILNILDRPDAGEYIVEFSFRDFLVFQSSFVIKSNDSGFKDDKPDDSLPTQANAGSPLSIIIGVLIPFLIAIPICCCCLRRRMQREMAKNIELAKSSQQRLPPAGQSNSGSEFEIALLKKSDSVASSAKEDKFIQSRDQIDGQSENRSDRDNSEAFMSCSSRPESVQSDDRSAAMVIFPDGTIKKIAAEKVQKMSNHMADVTLDFAENERFIHGTLRKSQKKKNGQKPDGRNLSN